MSEGQRLRHELADHDRQVRDSGYDERERDPFRSFADRFDAAQLGNEPRGDGFAAKRGGGGADDGDADLNGGKKSFGVVAQPEYGTGAAFALLGKLLDARLSKSDDGDLGTREEAVRENQSDDDDDLEENETAFRRAALPLRPKCSVRAAGSEKRLETRSPIAPCRRDANAA